MSLRTVTVVGGDLLQVAAQYLGDPLQWTRIAKLNGLWDPRLSGTVTLKLPGQQANSAQSGVIGL